MLTVLMIDDDEDVVATVEDQAGQVIAGLKFVSETDFSQASEVLRVVRPDIVILDVYQGTPATGEPAGEAVWEQVWRNWFCPIVIYTAYSVEFQERPPVDHPFVKMVSKGSGTEHIVLTHVQEFAPHALDIGETLAEMGRVTNAVLRDMAAVVFKGTQDPERRREILLRSARRRVAAMMDESLSHTSKPLMSWEQYIFPVLTSHPIMCDILRDVNGDPDAPSSYCVVLTPTCDMVPQASGCKVSQVLVAKCSEASDYVTSGLSLAAGTGKSKVKERLTKALNDAHQSGYVLLPECPGTTPMMALNLRNLALVPVTSIAKESTGDCSYVRVASLDSPFREYVAWAFLQVSCRPGVPPKDDSGVVEALLQSWGIRDTDVKK